MIEKSIIKKYTCTVKNCFIGNRDYKDLTVTAYIVRYSLWGLVWYKIKTYRPRIKGICDGHYYTQTALRNAASNCKEQCKCFLLELKTK